MKLLKSVTLVSCMLVAACSSVEEKPEQVVEPVAAAPVTIDTGWLDGYEARVRESLKGSHFEVERRGDLLVVVAPVQGTFNPDRPHMLLPATLGPITRLAKLVEVDKDAVVLIFGHSDNLGEAEQNFALSSKRAGAFGSIFRLSGLGNERLIIKGVGADLPRATNETKKGRALNRRVELVLVPRIGTDLLIAEYENASFQIENGDTGEAKGPTQLAAAEAAKAKPKK